MQLYGHWRIMCFASCTFMYVPFSVDGKKNYRNAQHITQINFSLQWEVFVRRKCSLSESEWASDCVCVCVVFIFLEFAFCTVNISYTIRVCVRVSCISSNRWSISTRLCLRYDTQSSYIQVHIHIFTIYTMYLITELNLIGFTLRQANFFCVVNAIT